MKKLLLYITFIPILVWNFFANSARSDTDPIKAILTWKHPKLKEPVVNELSDEKKLKRLLSAFDGLQNSQEGVPYDTPFYDLDIEFYFSDGKRIRTSVYLPRLLTFSGMWKHPESKALNYFDPQKQEPKILVDELLEYIPDVYPQNADVSKGIPYNKGIPDFSETDLPISGEFPPGALE